MSSSEPAFRRVERDLMEAESDLGLGSESDSLSSDEEETAECEYNPQPLLTTQQKMRNLQLYVSEEAEAAPANNNIRSFVQIVLILIQC